MKEFLYGIIDIITWFHRKITGLNNVYNISLTDKQLHFWVFGALCVGIFIFVHLFFKYISKFSLKTISWFYTLTVAVVLAFAIEIGQKQTNTGNMEFADIVYGIYGFIVLFFVYQLIEYFIKMIHHAIITSNARILAQELQEKEKSSDFGSPLD